MERRTVTPGFLVAAAVWLACCLIADVDEGQQAGPFLAGALARALVTLLVAVALRWLYLRGHAGTVGDAGTMWVAAAIATLLAAGRLSSGDRAP